MSLPEDPRRRRGVVMAFDYHYSHDRECWLGKLTVDIPDGADVGFGAFCFDTETTGKAFVEDICRIFGAPPVSATLSLLGKECWVLYNRGTGSMTELPAGVESMTGERFTIQGFRRIHHQDVPTAYEAARREVQREIDHLELRLTQERTKLARLPHGFVDWETAPKGYLIPREPLEEEADKATETP